MLGVVVVPLANAVCIACQSVAVGLKKHCARSTGVVTGPMNNAAATLNSGLVPFCTQELLCVHRRIESNWPEVIVFWYVVEPLKYIVSLNRFCMETPIAASDIESPLSACP